MLLWLPFNRGTVCDDGFSEAAARVVCRQLGLSETGARVVNTILYGIGNGLIWLDNIKCKGDEARLEDCAHSEYGDHNCNHEEDIAVSCGASLPGAATSLKVSLTHILALLVCPSLHHVFMWEHQASTTMAHHLMCHMPFASNCAATCSHRALGGC